MTQQRGRRVLNGRYEIEDLLGQGGMARVFRGQDKVLGRTVAVKVLSPQFAGDDQFVARFRREAQAAAALNHPNIVSVYDTGDQGDVHYIVMEYVEGRTLRDVIRQDGPLLPERASEIAGSVARALASAHEGGLVHRDIKPGNIMLTRDGEVKVMDFGIARTSTGDTLTQTAAILGTASYLSPEQAQGATVDARSDIYSLGCVLYEMLTGRAPFTGDSPVSIAYKHVREDPVPPSHLNGDVPEELEAVVMKSMAKNPDNRYQTAEEMREDLDRAAAGMPTLATPLLGGEPTQAVTRRMPEDGTAVMTGVPPDERPERKRRWWIALLVLLLLAALGAAAFFLVRELLPQEPTGVLVPDVVGETEDDAIRILEDRGFRVQAEREFNEDVPRNEVFEQDPEEGERIARGDTVTITVSRGAQPVEVPGVVGLTEEEARAALADAELRVGTVSRQASEEEEGTVIAQDPGEGERVRPGFGVSLTVSSGPETVAVPDVICQDMGSAQAEVEQAGLDFAPTGTRTTDECPPGTVAAQNPAPGAEVVRGTNVRVKEAVAPEPSPSPILPTPTPTIGED
ncbi:MAG TPA: Stk1 family PASTA domain-containing Ser/Thr kinase [Actinomycetota bacterium]|nr:Stk1 family PASTA domain-containing Ser/Thr kinase [Actinomycetota bacterium]